MNNALSFLGSLAKFKIGDLAIYRYYDQELGDYVVLDTQILVVKYCSDEKLGPYVKYIVRDWSGWEIEVYENELERI